MKPHKRLRLTNWQTFCHYSVVYLLLIPAIFTSISLFQIYISKNYEGPREPKELLWTYISIIPATLLFLIQRQRLRFKELSIAADSNMFITAAEKSAERLGWVFHEKSQNQIIATRPGGLSSGSWGELITIIRVDDKIFINSICDPEKITSIASFGWNKKSINTFKEILESQHTTSVLHYQG